MFIPVCDLCKTKGDQYDEGSILLYGWKKVKIGVEYARGKDFAFCKECVAKLGISTTSSEDELLDSLRMFIQENSCQGD